MAIPPLVKPVCSGIHGRYSLPCKERRTNRKKAVYIAIGIDMDGERDVIGMWVGENESAKFWLSAMNVLRNRGLEDIQHKMNDPCGVALDTPALLC